MIVRNPGPAIFEADPEDEFRLSFTVPDSTERSGRRPIMTFRCFEEDKLRGAIVFLGERQHLWHEWRRIAEEESGAVLAERLTEMAMADARKRFGSPDYMFEMCMGATADRTGRENEISLSMMLATRTLHIARHSFADEPSLNAFLGSLIEKDRIAGCVELAELALLEGRDALARKLDAIALRHLGSAGRTKH